MKTRRAQKIDTAWHQRQYVWKHNGLRGSVVMMEKILWRIVGSPSTTDYAKELAKLMLTHAKELNTAMIVRVDP